MPYLAGSHPVFDWPDREPFCFWADFKRKEEPMFGEMEVKNRRKGRHKGRGKKR
jgi:hypothetical protein